jgi:hypothetical protein
MATQCRLRPNEDAEELIRAGVNLAATGPVRAAPEDRAHVGQHRGVPIAEPVEEARRAFDIGQEKGHTPGRQGSHLAGLGFDLASKPLVLDRQPERGGHRLHQVRILQHGAIVDQRGHRLALALEQRHRPARS